MRYLAFTNDGIFESEKPKVTMFEYEDISDQIDYWDKRMGEETTKINTITIICDWPIPATDIRVGFAPDFDHNKLPGGQK